MFHPSIRSQIDNIGNTYEQQHAEAVRIHKEIMFFFEYSQSTMKKLIRQNDRLLEKIRKPSIPDELCRKETELSDQLARMTLAYQPKFKELIETKPLLDRIFDFEKRLLKDLQQLDRLSEDRKQSNVILQALENEHRTVTQLLEKVKFRLAHCKKLMDELNSFSQHQLN